MGQDWSKFTNGYPGAFLVQGASVVYYFLGKYIRSRFWLTIIVVFVALQPLLSTILSWVGVFDFCFDLRKIRGK